MHAQVRGRDESDSRSNKINPMLHPGCCFWDSTNKNSKWEERGPFSLFTLLFSERLILTKSHRRTVLQSNRGNRVNVK